MTHKRKVLSLLADELSLAELQTIATRLEVRATQGRSKAALVEALASSHTAGLTDILQYCSRSLLKQICGRMELSDAGKTNECLIARIVDEDDHSGWSLYELREFLTNRLRIPDELNHAERTHVKRSFGELRTQAPPNGLPGARKIVAPAAARLRRAKAVWRHRVAEVAERLAALAEAPPEGSELPNEEMRAVVAAVRYVSTTESVLPDWDPRTAIDDAYVFELCLAELARPALLAIAHGLD